MVITHELLSMGKYMYGYFLELNNHNENIDGNNLFSKSNSTFAGQIYG